MANSWRERWPERSSERQRRDVELVRGLVRSIPDFPRAGILFRDIMPVLRDAVALQAAFRLHLDTVAELAQPLDAVMAIESRGFLFGMCLAQALELAFVPVRKLGKLPGETLQDRYQLEYGQGTLEVHADALKAGTRVLILDDLLATGGTCAAAIRLARRLDADVRACVFLIELDGIHGREELAPVPVASILHY